ncbi:MAG: hypothetical protein GF416_05960 [Candidatus Altiarchaeales archaeon]|nr:hypothetical protein [Candidatus Altiarchaeales archaeon]MBD3416660.1 hypothetical protein [Candidatus Altiarchaeales archaeon]
MNYDEVKRLIESGENQEVEFKESLQSKEKIAKQICAFANTNGGTIVFGVNRKRKIVGLEGDLDTAQQKISLISQDISSPPLISQEVIQIDGKPLLLVIIHRANQGNFHTFKGLIYVRIGSTVHKLEGHSMLDYLRDRQILCFDEAISEANLEDLDEEKIKKFLKIRGQGEFLIENSIDNFLLSNRLAHQNDHLKIKNAAALFFSKNLSQFVPQAELKLVKYSGTEAVDIISYKLVKSDPIEQIELAYSFIKENIITRLKPTSESAIRTEIYEYPLTVIRESIVNAVAHRDYFSKDAIQVNIFDDRIEIISPGSLPSGMSPDKLGFLSVQRNPLTYRLLRDLGYVEGLGTGIPRMRNEMRKAGLKDPLFDYSGNFFIVVLMNLRGVLKPVEGMGDLNERQIKAIDYLKQNQSIKSKTYASINDISVPTAVNDLRELIRFKFIRKIGKYRGAYYVLNEEKFTI